MSAAVRCIEETRREVEAWIAIEMSRIDARLDNLEAGISQLEADQFKLTDTLASQTMAHQIGLDEHKPEGAK